MTSKLYINKDTVNSFYLEIYELTLDCLLKFGCPIVFDMYERNKVTYVRLLCNKMCNKIDMVLRYLQLELSTLQRVSEVKFEYSINVIELSLNRLSLNEIENTTRFLNKIKNNDIKEYKKPLYN